jgi:hypothetical protein
VKPIVLGIIKLMETTIAVKAIRFYVYLCLYTGAVWSILHGKTNALTALLYCKMVHFPSSDLHLLHGKPLFRGQIRLQRWKLSWKARWNHQLDYVMISSTFCADNSSAPAATESSELFSQELLSMAFQYFRNENRSHRGFFRTSYLRMDMDRRSCSKLSCPDTVSCMKFREV